MSKAKIYYYDIGDYLSREEKLKIIKDFKTVNNIPFKVLKPNEHGDWINKRNDSFSSYIPLAPEKKFNLKTQSFFNLNVIGISTNRDAWVYNFSKNALDNNMSRMIDFYNEQTEDFIKKRQLKQDIKVEEFIDSNPLKISWTRALRKDTDKNIIHSFKEDEKRIGVYRPFTKQNLYFDKPFIESPGLNSILFPDMNTENLSICITGSGASKEFSVLITDGFSGIDTVEKNQNFPLYYYEENKNTQRSLFDDISTGSISDNYIRRDGISDFILERAKKQYGSPSTGSGSISKEDIFYYVYGFLHSKEYRETFENDLKKMLPRLPLVDDVRDFWAFSNAGRKLAELHLNYESVPAYSDVTLTGDDGVSYLVQKMRFPKKEQKDTIIYNSKITITNIPEKAYEYVVNGKSAIEWIMERYQVKTDKKSGIKNDPNDWAKEHNQPRYILDLLLSIINVSVQTVDIVSSLPKVDFETE